MTITIVYMVNTFCFREPEFYYQEQDQRSDENNFVNIYFRAFDFFNKSFIENHSIYWKNQKLKNIYSQSDFYRFFGPAPGYSLVQQCEKI